MWQYNDDEDESKLLEDLWFKFEYSHPIVKALVLIAIVVAVCVAFYLLQINNVNTVTQRELFRQLL